MYTQDFLKVAAVTPKLRVGNPPYNIERHLEALKGLNASVAVFPELSVTGYTCNDLFFQHGLIQASDEAVETFLSRNPFEGIVLFGAPLEVDGVLYNVAFVIQGEEILGIVPKFFLPNTQEFYEKRWFTRAEELVRDTSLVEFRGRTVPFGALIFRERNHHFSFGVEICEDMWAPISPGNHLALKGAQVIFNLSASNEYLGKHLVRQRTIVEHSRRNAGAYVYASAGVCESTSETVFSGHNAIAQNGRLLAETERFARETDILKADLDLSKIAYTRKSHSSFRDSMNRFDFDALDVPFTLTPTADFTFEKALDRTPFVPKVNEADAFERIAELQENALLRRVEHIGAKRLIVGVSGGLDSTLALLIAARVVDTLGLPRRAILGVTLPAQGSGERTQNQAGRLIEALGVEHRNLSITQAVEDHFALIGHDGEPDVTYENVQARMRTMALLNLANQEDGMVVGTGDMSELALGWTTYGADHMSMYNINAGLPKTLVRFMVAQYAQRRFEGGAETVAEDVLKTPISPELIQGQKTEDTLGSYEVNDFILDRLLRSGDAPKRIEWLLEKTFDLDQPSAERYVSRFLRRFDAAQFKRQTSPDGPKVLDVSLSPRSDFRMPSDIRRDGD